MKQKIQKALETYSKYAKIYAEYTFPMLLQFQLNRFISLLNGKKILDVGCGPGRDAQYFKEEDLDVVGIDIAEGMINEAKKRVKGIKFSLMDMRDLKFKDESFDGIWCMAALSHTDKNDIPKILKELYRVLKKEGIIYIAVKEGEGERLVKKEEYNGAQVYSVFYSQIEMEQLLTDNGFSIISNEVNEDNRVSWVEIFARKI